MDNLKCPNCEKTFTKKYSVKRHLANCGSNASKIQCPNCAKKFTQKDNMRIHLKRCQIKNQAVENLQEQSTTTLEDNSNVNMQPTTSSTENFNEFFNDDFEECLTPRFLEFCDKYAVKDYWFCGYCDESVAPRDKLKHLLSSKHKDNALIKYQEDTYLVANCFGDKILIYRLINEEEANLSIERFLSKKKDMIIQILKKYVQLHTNINFQMEVTTTFTKPGVEGDSIQAPFYISNKYSTLNVSDVEKKLTEKIDEIFQQLSRNSEEIVTRGSNWTLSKIHHMDLHINKKESLLGGTFIKLPRFIQNKTACINPVKQNEQCFKWSVLAYFLYEILKEDFQRKISKIKLNHVLTSACRRSKIQNEYKKLRKRLSNISSADEDLVNNKYHVSFDHVDFPTMLENLDDFILLNPEINLNVFGICAENNKKIVGPLYTSRREATHNINLLLLTNNKEQSHFCFIRDLSRLAARQKKKHANRQHYCNICLLAFNSEEKLQSHKENGCLGKI